MLRHQKPEDPISRPLATSDELAEAVVLLRRQKEEEQRRQQESDALVAALAELGESVTREELLEAIAFVRARRESRHKLRRPNWQRPILSTIAAVIVFSAPLWLARRASQAPAVATMDPTGAVVSSDFDRDGFADLYVTTGEGRFVAIDTGKPVLPNPKP